mgnify:CR=1 FL=1
MEWARENDGLTTTLTGPGPDHGGLVVVDVDLGHEDDVADDISKSWTQ